MTEKQVISIGGKEIELRMDTTLMPSTLRAFIGKTPLDSEIEELPIPYRPLWLQLCVRLLRTYRRNRSPHIGNRCVFDPSCSHYSELAYRKHGLLRGTLKTMTRLRRCKPNAGGIDLP